MCCPISNRNVRRIGPGSASKSGPVILDGLHDPSTLSRSSGLSKLASLGFIIALYPMAKSNTQEDERFGGQKDTTRRWLEGTSAQIQKIQDPSEVGRTLLVPRAAIAGPKLVKQTFLRLQTRPRDIDHRKCE
jgi:hypothetical protein